MPSKKRPQSRRKRKQPKLWSPERDWTPWLWGFFLLHLAIGLLFSPVTGLRSVRVVGAPGYDHGRLRADLATFQDVPFLRVNQQRIKSLALQNLAVEEAEYRANLFGRAVLELEYRRPVAKLGKGVYLSDRGAVFPSPQAPDLPITVEPPYDPTEANLAAFSSWRSGLAARMCENIAERLPDRRWRLVVSKAGFVDLISEDGATVEFGSFEGTDLKVAALVEALQDDPDVLRKYSGLVLSSPSNPVRVP